MAWRPECGALVACVLAATLVAPACAFEGKVGGSLREQVEITSDDTLGQDGQSDRVLLHRLLLRLDGSTSSTLRGTLEFDTSAQGGRNGGSSPVDESEPDLHQGFLEWDLPLAAMQLRVGRQEWTLGSGRLVSVRDGPNIRRAFDAVQLRGRIGAAPWRAFVGRPVRNQEGSFDDREDRSQHLGGFALSFPLPAKAGALDLYALDYRRDDADFAFGTARERRRSAGLRWYAQGPVFDFNTELVGQRGDWGDARIRAWTLANDMGWQVPLGSRRVRLGLKADLASGDRDPDDSRLQTFNALYPNPSYFSDAALIAPANLIDLQPNVGLLLSESMHLYAGWNLLWKHRRADAVYTTPVPLTPVADSAGGGRWIGQQAQLSARWTPREFVSLEASYVHLRPGRVLSSLQEDPIDFLQLVVTLSF